MTLPPFVDGNILYAAELNQLRLDLKADATSKDNALAGVLRGEIEDAQLAAEADASAKVAALEVKVDDNTDDIASTANDLAVFQAAVGQAVLDLGNRITALEQATRDTGWRVLTLANDWLGSVRIKRTGSTVHVIMHDLRGGTAPPVVQFPVGFRPWSGGVTQPVRSGQNAFSFTTVRWSGELNLPTATTLFGNAFEFSFETSDAWPSTLPGSPA